MLGGEPRPAPNVGKAVLREGCPRSLRLLSPRPEPGRHGRPPACPWRCSPRPDSLTGWPGGMTTGRGRRLAETPGTLRPALTVPCLHRWGQPRDPHPPHRCPEAPGPGLDPTATVWDLDLRDGHGGRRGGGCHIIGSAATPLRPHSGCRSFAGLMVSTRPPGSGTWPPLSVELPRGQLAASGPGVQGCPPAALLWACSASIILISGRHAAMWSHLIMGGDTALGPSPRAQVQDRGGLPWPLAGVTAPPVRVRRVQRSQGSSTSPFPSQSGLHGRETWVGFRST